MEKFARRVGWWFLIFAAFYIAIELDKHRQAQKDCFKAYQVKEYYIYEGEHYSTLYCQTNTSPSIWEATKRSR